MCCTTADMRRIWASPALWGIQCLAYHHGEVVRSPVHNSYTSQQSRENELTNTSPGRRVLHWRCYDGAFADTPSPISSNRCRAFDVSKYTIHRDFPACQRSSLASLQCQVQAQRAVRGMMLSPKSPLARGPRQNQRVSFGLPEASREAEGCGNPQFQWAWTVWEPLGSTLWSLLRHH